MKKLEFQSNRYDYCKDVTWEDVIKKISNGFDTSTIKFLNYKEYVQTDGMSIVKEYAPSFVMHNKYFPGSLQKVYNKVKESEGIDDMHIYTSFGCGSPTFGNHKDTVDVLIVQAVGRMAYGINDKEYLLNPGDGIVIPCGVYHFPLVIEPRITLSFSW